MREKRFKKLALLFLALAFVACRSGDTTPLTTPIPREKSDDFQVQYYWEVGALPPPYFYSYTITIGPGLAGQITFEAGYEPDEESTWVESFPLTEGDLQQLYEKMYDAGIFEGEWKQQEDIPTGGSADKMTVIAYSAKYKIPSYVDGDEKARSIRAIYDQIEGYVTQEIWEELNAKHERYVQEHEDEE